MKTKKDSHPKFILFALCFALGAHATWVHAEKGDSGSKGSKGDTGDKGDTGAIGATGATGATGTAGVTGVTGTTGGISAAAIEITVTGSTYDGTETTDTLITGMTSTPGAGTYVVTYSADAYTSSTAHTQYITIYANGSAKTASVRRFNLTNYQPVYTQALVTVSAGQTIEVRHRMSGAGQHGYHFARSMTLMPVTP